MGAPSANVNCLPAPGLGKVVRVHRATEIEDTG
jgi:hypothetical protein